MNIDRFPFPLQQLRALDGSSPQFPDHLSVLLDTEEFNNHIPCLLPGDAKRFVDYLDAVNTFPCAYIPLSEANPGPPQPPPGQSRRSEVSARTNASVRHSCNPPGIVHHFSPFHQRQRTVFYLYGYLGFARRNQEGALLIQPLLPVLRR